MVEKHLSEAESTKALLERKADFHDERQLPLFREHWVNAAVFRDEPAWFFFGFTYCTEPDVTYPQPSSSTQ